MNGKGDKRRPGKPGVYEQNHASINWAKSVEYCLAFDDDAEYVIRADEVAVFEHWIAAREGKRHYPADFIPHRLTSGALTNLRFREWREVK